MIGERHLAEQFHVVVAVEGTPAAVSTLHRLEPGNGATDGGLNTRQPGNRRGVTPGGQRVEPGRQRDQHHRSVVDIGVKAVGILEAPARRDDPGCIVRPVAWSANLTIEEPVHGGHQRIGEVIRTRQRKVDGIAARRQSSPGSCSIRQRAQGNRGIPHGRSAGLEPRGAIRLVFHEQVQLPPALLHLRRVVITAHGPQGQDAPDDGREDRPQAVAAVKPLEHPTPAGGHSAAAQRAKADVVACLQQPIDTAKKSGPSAAATDGSRAIPTHL